MDRFPSSLLVLLLGAAWTAPARADSFATANSIVTATILQPAGAAPIPSTACTAPAGSP